MAAFNSDPSQPLSGLLSGYQQGQATSRQQALDVANQIAAQHAQEWQEEQAQAAASQQKVDNDLRKQSLDEQNRHNTVTETQGQERVKNTADRTQQTFSDKANARILKEFTYLTGMGMPTPQAWGLSTAHETLRQHSIPGSSIPGALPQELDPDETPIGGPITLPGAQGVTATNPAAPGPAAAPDPMTTLLNMGVPAILQPSPTAPTIPQVGAAPVGTPAPQAAPQSPQTGAQSSVQTLMNMVPGMRAAAPSSASSGTAGAVVSPPAPSDVLPKVQAGIDRTKAQTANTGARTDWYQARTQTEDALRDPKINNLLSLMDNRQAMQVEKVRHDQMTEGLTQAAQKIQQTLGTVRNNIAQQNANTNAKNATTNATRASQAQNNQNIAQDARRTQQLLSMNGQAYKMYHDSQAELNKLQAEQNKLQDFVQKTPQPVPAMYPGNDGAYQKALADWQTKQAYAGARLQIIAPRIQTLTQSSAQLKAQTDAASEYLNNKVTPINSSGAPQRGASNMFPAGSASTPNLSFVHNDGDQANPNFRAYVNSLAAANGMQVKVGTAVQGHTPNVVIAGRDTGRPSQHGSGNAFDITQIKGPDGQWHNANVNDPVGYQLALQLGHAAAQAGHQAIFGVNLPQTGNHMDHLHIGFHPNGDGTSFLPAQNASLQDAIGASKSAWKSSGAGGGSPAAANRSNAPAATPARGNSSTAKPAQSGAKTVLHYDPVSGTFH